MKKRLLFFSALIVGCLVIETVNAQNNSIKAEDYWKMPNGYNATFSNNMQVNVSSVTNPQISANSYEMTFTNHPSRFYNYDPEGNLRKYGGRWRDGSFFIYTPEGPVYLRANLEIGTYGLQLTTKEYDVNGSYHGTGNHDVEVTVTGPENTAVGGNSFNTYKLKEVITWRDSWGANGRNIYEYWLVENRGIIKFSRDGVTYELTRVNNPQPPPAPQNIRAGMNGTNVSLSWDPVPNADGYYLLKDPTPCGQQFDTQLDNLIDYEDTTNASFPLQEGECIWVAVQAYNTAGTSGYSNPQAFPNYVQVPTAPANFNVQPTGNTVTLSWDPVLSAEGYRLLIDPSQPGQPFDGTFDIPPVDLGIITGIGPVEIPEGFCFNVAVQAYNAGGTSDTSAIGQIYIPPAFPQTPTNFNVHVDGVSVTLSWDAVPNAVGYKLLLGLPQPGQPFDGNCDIPAELGNMTRLGPVKLPENTLLYVEVQAYNDAGSSDSTVVEEISIQASQSSILNSVGMRFNKISEGTFSMGSPTDETGRSDSEVQHEVTITKKFYIQTTEVTQTQWEMVMGSNPSEFSNCPTCPVEMVSWDDVQEFIRKINESEGTARYRLPTEAEWEYAARAGSTTVFANNLGFHRAGIGNVDVNLNTLGWYMNDTNEPRSVAGRAPNSWGLSDMHGNVRELCQDWSGNYPLGPVQDPIGPPEGTERVVRGGGWNDPVAKCRLAARDKSLPDARNNNIGFRLVKDL